MATGGSAGCAGRGGGAPALEKPWTPPYCAVVAVDTEQFCYRVCSICERTLSDGAPCSVCSRRCASCPGSKHLYRLLMSVGTVDKVIVVVCFDRAARAIMGCSADELLHLFAAHPSAARKVEELLGGEMFRMTLSRSKRGNAEHLRVTAVTPLRTGFRPVAETLRRIYGAASAGSSSNNNNTKQSVSGPLM